MPSVITCQGFYLDSLSPQISQHHAASWAHHHVGKFNDANARKRQLGRGTVR